MTSQLPGGFLVRPATLEDARILSTFMRYCQQVEYGFAIVKNEEETLTVWTSPDVELAHDTRLIFSPHNQLVAYLHLRRQQPVRMSLVLMVHPEYADLGLQAWLLAYAEERARQLISLAPADARVSLSISMSGSTNIYQQALEQTGFVYVRSELRMEIEMTGSPPAAHWPEGISLRPFTLEMAPVVHQTEEAFFRDHWGYTPMTFEAFHHEYIAMPEFDPTLWFLPFEGEQITGLALCERQEESGWVNTLGVLRPWRRQGLALALLHHAFGELYRRGERKVSLWVDAQSLTGATRLYERAGMQVARHFNQYEKELRAGNELSTQTLDS